VELELEWRMWTKESEKVKEIMEKEREEEKHIFIVFKMFLNF